MEIVGPVNAVERGAVGTEDAQLSMKGLEEFGMVTLLPELLGPPSGRASWKLVDGCYDVGIQNLL